MAGGGNCRLRVYSGFPAMLTRRSFLRSTIVLSGGAGLRGLARGERHATLRLVHGGAAVQVPANFIGLGYEMLSAAQPELLCARDAVYVRLVRNLGSEGVLRFGGIVADFTRYAPVGPVRTEPKNTVVSEASLQQLRGFLNATGWTAIWSVNFGRGTLAEAVAEARAVHRILGPKLTALELGNEVENYGRGSHPARPAGWGFTRYLAEYREWRRAILSAVPGVCFAAPDTAASVAWVEQMAEQARGEVQLLTTHFYLGDQRKATLAQMVQPSADLASRIARLGEISRSSGTPWRMCETNSFFGGGHAGLSDTFAGALWTLNYMLLLAQAGCAGVNLETGVNQLGFLSWYSPIRSDAMGAVTVGAPYYGMLAFAAAGADGAEMLPVESADAEMTAYAMGRQGRARAAVILNWSDVDPVRVSLAGLELHAAEVLRLAAPTLLSKYGVTLGGAAVDGQGRWSPARVERMHGDELKVDPVSAVVVRQMRPAGVQGRS